MSEVQMREGWFGVTRGGEVHQLEWLRGNGFSIMVPGWTFFLNDDGSCPGAEDHDLIATFSTRAEAEAYLAEPERPVTPLPETGVDAPIDVSEAELQAATDAIVREYGRVIGRPQARNIAYISLVAARCAWFAAKEPTA